MKNKNFMLAIISLAVFSLASTANANLISNGSFEEDASLFVDNGQETMVLTTGSTVLSGWTVTGDQIAWLYDDYWGLTASDGNYFLDLTSYSPGGSGGVASATIATVIGQSYTLSFDLGSSTTYGGSPSIIATAGSTTQTFSTVAAGANQWDTFSMSFIANSANTTINLTGLGTGSLYNGYYIGLDNVSVVASSVPEPSTFILLGLTLAGLGIRRR